MNDERLIDPNHDNVRNLLRIIGPVVALTGLVFVAVGMISFFSSFGTFEPPRYFWCMFVGMPLLAIGIAITKFAFLGAILRYLSGQAAPVSKDTFNYLAHGTTPGVRDISRAVAQGFAEGAHGERAGADCPTCRATNPEGAKFCNGCGTALVG